MADKTIELPRDALCTLWRECQYVRGYIRDTERTIKEMAESEDKEVYRYAQKELKYIRNYLQNICGKITEYAHKEDE